MIGITSPGCEYGAADGASRGSDGSRLSGLGAMNRKHVGLVFLLFLTVPVSSVPSQQRPKGPRLPRDRSEFTHIREEGFPLNVNPEIVSAEDAPLEDGDMVMGVIHNRVR